MPHLEAAPDPWRIAGDDALRLLEAKKFKAARALLEGLISSGEDAPPLMLVVYAICLSELGETRAAKDVCAILASAGDAEVDAILKAAAAWLPGGAQSRGRREDLRSAAERWLPRASTTGEEGTR